MIIGIVCFVSISIPIIRVFGFYIDNGLTYVISL
jgi:hypothetical protein